MARSGRVGKVFANLGGAVQAGDPLVSLDDIEASSELRIAEAALTDAQIVAEDAVRYLERVTHIGEAASGADLESAGSAVRRADAAVLAADGRRALASSNLRNMTLRAPFTGVVAWADAEPGQVVAAGAPVVRLVDTTTLVVDIGLLADEVALVAPGQPATVTSGSTEVAAIITEVAPAANPHTRDWSARLSLQPTSLPAGTPVQVVLSLPTSVQAALVPAEAVKNGEVWVVSKERVVRRHPVKVVAEDRAGLLVTGLEPGLQVVRFSTAALNEGAVVKLLEAP